MRWLSDFFKVGARWVIKNPLTIALVIIVLVWNHYFQLRGIDVSAVDVWHAETLWLVGMKAVAFFLSPAGLWLWFTTGVAAAAITMLNTGALFGIFRHDKSPLKTGLRFMLSMRTFSYWLVHIVTTLILVVPFITLAYSVIFLFGLTGITGSVLLGVVAVIAYPLLYVWLSTSSLIIGTNAPLREQFSFLHTFLKKKNLKRLSVFYAVRIGGETAVLLAAAGVASYFHLPAVITILLVILIASVPLALVRTTGLVLKLDMLRDEPWFREYFKTYYETKPKT